MKCFADLGEGKPCIALRKKDCEDCSFYKTKGQVEQEERLVRERREYLKNEFNNVKISILK